MNNTADAVVIGGGIIGCSAAYYLAKLGASVIVLEGSDNIGNGGSTRNGGGVRQSGRDVRELPLVMYGIKNLWPTLSEELEVDCEYHQDGNLRLGKNEKHAKILTGLADKARAVGLDVRIIDGDEVRRINPYLSEEVTVASWCPTDGHANPLTTTLGYYKAARKLGVRFITGEYVTELKTSTDTAYTTRSFKTVSTGRDHGRPSTCTLESPVPDPRGLYIRSAASGPL